MARSFLIPLQYAGALIALCLPARMGQSAPDERDLLLQRHGIVALDRTDRHSPFVIENLMLLLEHGFPGGVTRRLHNLRYVYAYRGHDAHDDVAAYHWEAKAISVGGRGAYGAAGGDAARVSVLAALAHEIGHAFVLQELSPAELRAAAERFGGWGPVFAGRPADSFMAPAFFTRLRDPGTRPENHVSGYAATNTHEWFADAFAALALRRLGEGGHLGRRWRSLLARSPRRREDYWVDYGNISAGFADWLGRRIARTLAPRGQF